MGLEPLWTTSFGKTAQRLMQGSISAGTVSGMCSRIEQGDGGGVPAAE